MKKFLKLIAYSMLFLLSIKVCYAKTQLTFQIYGVKNEVLVNVKSRLGILQKTYGDQLSTTVVQNIFQQAISEIQKAMEPFGYFKSTIRVSLNHQNETWVASYYIKPGPVITIEKIDINIQGPGKDNTTLQNYVRNFPLKVGDKFIAPQYEKAKENFINTANEEGYIKNSLEENQVYIDPKSNHATIIIHLQTGELYKFGTIDFSKGPYSSDFLHRFVRFSPNETFSSQKLTKLQEQLTNSNYFQQAQVVPDFEHTINNRVPVKISTVAPKSQRYNIGIGYGSLTGPRLTAGINFRRLTDTGEHFDAQLKLSSVLSGLAAKYYIPGKNPISDQWVVGFNYQRFLPQNGSSSSGTFSAGYLKKIDHLQTTLDINYLMERYKVDNQPSEINKLLYPNLNIFYSQADDLIHPDNGKSLNLILRGSSEAFYSSTNFLQAEIKAKYLFSPTNFSHLIFRGDLGYTVVHNIQNLPLSMRFFAGGTNSIRGYKDSGIGPGRYLEIGSVEYQHHLTGNWTGAVFYDFGTASNHWGTSFSRSEGIGIIYQSMIGPIKLYGAKANDRAKPYSIEFSIGPEF